MARQHGKSPAGDPTTVVDLAEACRRLGFSKRTGEKLIAEGRFPIPALPSLGVRRYRFSSTTLDRYLQTADTRG